MKNIFYYLFTCSFCLFAFSACTDDDDELTTNGSEFTYPQPKPNDVINEKVFDVINLDYPGLEQVKTHYEEGNLYYAAKALLNYYQRRTGVPTNPLLNLMNITATTDDANKAENALTYRFFVNGFTDKNGLPYQLKKTDGKLNWDNHPDGTSDEYPKQLHRHQWFIPQAKVYRTTGNEQHVLSWIDVYGDWIVQNPKPTEEVKDIKPWWQLQTATRLEAQVELFEYYKNSTNFTPEWLSVFLCSFADHCDYLTQYKYASGGNVLATQARALVFAGTLYPEFKNSEKWAETGFGYIGDQFLEDGMHEELDLSYHIDVFTTCSELLKLVNANNLNNPFASNIKKSLEKAGNIIVKFTYPHYFDGPNFDGKDPEVRNHFVPGFNDTRQSSWSRSVLNKKFILAHEFFPDNEEFKYMVGYGKNGGTCPSDEIRVFKESGYYILRNGWKKSSTMMILSNNYLNNGDPKNSPWSHNQPDNGTFELYHNGRNFFPDSGVCEYYSYSGSTAAQTNARRAKFRSSKMHNTLTLNGKNYTSTLGKYLSHGTIDNGKTKVVVFENQGYSNLKHRRYVFFVNNTFFVIVDEGIGEGVKSEPVLLHFNLCDGGTVITNNADKSARATFSDDNNIIISTVFANGTYTLTDSKEGEMSFKASDEAFTFPRPAYYLTMEAGERTADRFLTVIYPKQGSLDDVKITGSMNADYNANGVSGITVTVDGETYNLSYTL